MPAERYYCPQDFQEGGTVFLEENELHHLTHVMRNRSGDIVEIVNGQGQLANARIETVKKKQAELHIAELFQSPKLDTPLILVQAIPRLNKLELILEKGTELGMTEVWLFPASRTEKKQFTENQLLRLKLILISAMKQCGRLFLPELILMPPLKDWESFYLPAFFGDIRPDAPLFFNQWTQLSPKNGVIFCVGPEGGFAKEETASLKSLGAVGVRLNDHILRTETAAINALSLASHFQLQCSK